MPRTYVQVSSFAPSLFLAPILAGPNAAGKDAINAAIGGFIEGVVQSHSEHKGDNNHVSHYYSMLVEDSSLKTAQVYLEDTKTYNPIPFVPFEVYSVKASGQLHYQLANVPFGCPVKITYLGVKSYQKDIIEEGKPKKITVSSHQFSVGRDTEYVPALAAPGETRQLDHQTPYTDPVDPNPFSGEGGE